MNEKILFAERLKEARQKADISQAELSRRTGIASATLSSYEKGKMPPIDKAFQIAQALNVSLDWLCGCDAESSMNNDDFTPEQAMNALLVVLSINGLYCDTKDDMGNDYGYVHSIAIKNTTVQSFLMDYLKIKCILDDPNYEQYLKDGLVKAMIEKFKKYNLLEEQAKPVSYYPNGGEAPF